jgi:UDP-2,3-diacylglucosamine pyrophosphatase LpxH
VDGWNLGRSWYWSPAQNAVASELVDWERCGARIVFLPGDHDRLNLDLVETLCRRIAIQPELIHRSAASRQMITHRDQFGGSLNSVNSLSLMSGQAYRRERFELDRRSLVADLKCSLTKSGQLSHFHPFR